MTASIAEQHAVELSEAIAELYIVFALYPCNHPEGCPCCVSKDDTRRVASRPLQELTRRDLGKYAFKAMTTWGSVTDFKHFLPRLLELSFPEVPQVLACPAMPDTIRRMIEEEMRSGEWSWLDTEILYGKLSYGHWDGWPKREQAAVTRFLKAIWAVLIRTVPQIEEGLGFIESHLCAIGCTDTAMKPFLDDWADVTNRNGLIHLAMYVVDQAHDLCDTGELGSPFWSDHKASMQEVAAWLLSPRVTVLLESAPREPGSSEGILLAQAATALARIKAAPRYRALH